MSAPLELTADQVQALADASHDLTAWVKKGRALAQNDSERQFQFNVGDWLAAGQEKWGRKAYAEAVTIFRGYSHATLKDFCQVSRRVQLPLRNGSLPWAHHKAVSRFTNTDLQRELLAHAAKRGLSVSAFRKYVNERYPPAEKPKKSALTKLHEKLSALFTENADCPTNLLREVVRQLKNGPVSTEDEKTLRAVVNYLGLLSQVATKYGSELREFLKEEVAA